jgi:excisionase family DNA binding protein
MFAIELGSCRLAKITPFFGLLTVKHERYAHHIGQKQKSHAQIGQHPPLKFFIHDADIAFAMNNAVPATTALHSESLLTTEGEILTVMDVARFLRVPKSTVYKLARVGELPASKIGKHWRFLRRDIHEWMHSRSQQGA